jgi:hypothetical protein
LLASDTYDTVDTIGGHSSSRHRGPEGGLRGGGQRREGGRIDLERWGIGREKGRDGEEDEGVVMCDG